MKENIELIVLSLTKVREQSLVVQTLSREWGRRGFLVRSAPKGHAALLQPLSILEAEIADTPKSELKTLRSPGARYSLSGIRGNLYKNSMTLFLSEVLLRTIREGTCEDGLFDWCVGSILTLDALESDYANFPLRFLVEFSGALGFRPTREDILPFAQERSALLEPFLKEDFGSSMLAPLSGAVRSELCETLLRYLEFHTEQPIRVRSLAGLRELYK